MCVCVCVCVCVVNVRLIVAVRTRIYVLIFLLFVTRITSWLEISTWALMFSLHTDDGDNGRKPV